jgi:hypothetical protein
MNLFRPKEHVHNGKGFKSHTKEGMVQLFVLVQLFSGNPFTRRVDTDYGYHYPEYLGEFVAAIAGIGTIRPFWLSGGP